MGFFKRGVGVPTHSRFPLTALLNLELPPQKELIVVAGAL